MSESLPNTPNPTPEVSNQPLEPTPMPETKKSMSKIFPLVVILLLIIAGLVLVARQITPLKPTSIAPREKTATQSATLANPLRSYQGTVLSASASGLVVKSPTETKTFILASKYNIQKQSTGSANVKMSAPPKSLPITDVKSGQEVFLLVNKNTTQVVSILISSGPTLPAELQGTFVSFSSGKIIIQVNGNNESVPLGPFTMAKAPSNGSSVALTPVKPTELQAGQQVVLKTDTKTNKVSAIIIVEKL